MEGVASVLTVNDGAGPSLKVPCPHSACGVALSIVALGMTPPGGPPGMPCAARPETTRKRPLPRNATDRSPTCRDLETTNRYEALSIEPIAGDVPMEEDGGAPAPTVVAPATQEAHNQQNLERMKMLYRKMYPNPSRTLGTGDFVTVFGKNFESGPLHECGEHLRGLTKVVPDQDTRKLFIRVSPAEDWNDEAAAIAVWHLGAYYVGSLPPNPEGAVRGTRLVMLWIEQQSLSQIGTPPALLRMPNTTRGKIQREAERLQQNRLTKFMKEGVSLLPLHGVNAASEAGLACEMLWERAPARVGEMRVRSWGCLLRGWNYNETATESLMRGANKAAEEAARDAEGAWPLDEEGHLIEEPNLFDIKFDDAYTEVTSGPWAETALQMVTGVGANGTSVSLAIMPGVNSKDSRILAYTPRGEVTPDYEATLVKCVEAAFASSAPAATPPWFSLDSATYVEKVRKHDLDQTQRLWITATVPLRQSEVLDMLWGISEAVPIGLVPAIFTNPANMSKLHVMECVWGGASAPQSRQAVLEAGSLELTYKKTLTTNELWKLQAENPDVVAKVMLPRTKEDKAWYMAKHIVTNDWIFGAWPHLPPAP